MGTEAVVSLRIEDIIHRGVRVGSGPLGGRSGGSTRGPRCGIPSPCLGRIVSTTAGVNTRGSENLDHVRDAEVDRIRRGRFKGRRRYVGCACLRRSGADSAAGGQGCEAYDKFFTTTDGMAAELEATPVSVINSYYSLKELVIKFGWDRLMCKGKGLAIHDGLRLRVKVTWNSRSCLVCSE